MNFYDFYEKNNFHDGCVTAYKIKDSNEIAIVLFIFSNDFHSQYYYIMKGNIKFIDVKPNSVDFKFGIPQELFSIKYRKKSDDYFVDEMYGSNCIVKVNEVVMVEIDEKTYKKFSGLEQEYLPNKALKKFKN
jgi:hypothetical protein